MTYNINVTEAELNTIVNALAALPYRDTFQLISSISNQVQGQAHPSKTEVSPDTE